MATVLDARRKGQHPAELVDHVSARLDAETVSRLDALAPVVAPFGAKPSRSVAMRACILAGLDVLEARHTLPKETP